MIRKILAVIYLLGDCIYAEPALNTKGFDVCGMYAGEPEDIDYKIELAKKLGLNALVINVKNDNGILNIDLDDKHCQGDKNKLMKEVLKKCRGNGIYTIARIVCFADNVATVNDPDMAIKERCGSVLIANNRMWLNPYNDKVKSFIISIAEQSAILGFDEIRLDYLRFTGDKKRIKLTNIPLLETYKSKTQIIYEYINSIKDTLNKYQAKMSIDVLASTMPKLYDKYGTNKHGQLYVNLANNVDILSPMIYPSHLGKKIQNIKNPDWKPYKSTKLVMKCSNNALNKNYRKVSPWIQGFTANWLPKGQYRKYGRQEIQDQIDALRDCGIKSFCIWNMSLNYDDVLSNTGGGGSKSVMNN